MKQFTKIQFTATALGVVIIIVAAISNLSFDIVLPVLLVVIGVWTISPVRRTPNGNLESNSEVVE